MGFRHHQRPLRVSSVALSGDRQSRNNQTTALAGAQSCRDGDGGNRRPIDIVGGRV